MASRKTLSVESSLFVDSRIRAPWAVVERDVNANGNCRVVSHHETWAAAEADRAERAEAWLIDAENVARAREGLPPWSA